MILIDIPTLRQWTLIVTILLFFCPESRAQEKAFLKKDFQELDKLLGVWKTEKKNGFLYESWQKISDSEFQGKSFKIVGADTVVLERVRLAQDQGLSIVYAVRVDGENSGQETLFYLKKVTGGDYIFENLQHDFPKRIVYTIPKRDTLHAYIEGEIEGKNQRSDYNYVRAPLKN